MEQQAFHDLLVVLKQAKEKQVREDSEAIYFHFRSQTPSDSFIQCLVTEVISSENPEVQTYAQVLLKQDIEKQDDQCGLNRMSDPTRGEQLMQQLMEYAAQFPSSFLSQIIAAYAAMRISRGNNFDEVYEFVLQAAESPNANVRHMAATITSKLSSLDPELFRFEPLAFIQKLLDDTDDHVADKASEALFHLIEYDQTIPVQKINDDVLSQITLSILNRTAQTLTNGAYEVAQNQLESLSEIIDICGPVIIPQLPAVVTLLEQIVQADVTEPVKYKAIHIFRTICASCDNVRKQLLDLLSGFIRRCIVPNLILSDADYEEWLSTDKTVEYEDSSLRAGCEDGIETISHSLGKQVVFPLIKEMLAGASVSRDWRQAFAALSILKFGAKGVADVMKQKEVEQISDYLLQFLEHENPRVRFDALDTIAILADDFKPRLQKNHKVFIPAILVCANDQNFRVRAHAAVTLMDMLEGMSYEQTYAYLDDILQFCKQYYGQQHMSMQRGALSVMASVCDLVDKEDIEPVLQEFMPEVFNSFQTVMNAILTQPEFSKEQVDFISSMLDCIQAASHRVPELFADYVDMIASSFCTIASRAVTQQEFDLLDGAFSCVGSIAQTYADRVSSYVDSLYPIILNVISIDCMSYSTRPENEAEPEMDENRRLLQTEVLMHLSDFMNKFPLLYVVHLEELYKELRDFKHSDLNQLVAKQECLASLLVVASNGDADFQGLHSVIFKIFIESIMPNNDNTLTQELSLEQIGNQADALEIYITAYIKHVLKTNDDSSYQETLAQFFTMMNCIFKNAVSALKRGYQEIEDDDEYDAEERQAETENLVIDYDSAIDSIGAGYASFIVTFEDKIPPEIISKIVEATNLLMENGVESDAAVLQTMQAVSLYSDLAEFTTSEICAEVFKPAIPRFLEMMQEKKDEWQLVQVVMFAITSFLKKTNDTDIAGSTELLMLSVELLDAAKEDGSEDALSCYDNICSYMIVSGKLVGQASEYWKSLLGYLKDMSVDEEEIANTIRFLIVQIQENEVLKAMELDVLEVIINLFFGSYYSAIKNEESNAEHVDAIRRFLKKPTLQKKLKQLISTGNEFVKKNYNIFMQK